MSSKPLVLWMNGEFVPETEARISVFDDGFTRGNAVFDAARTFAGKPFQLPEHLARLERSCEALKLTPSLTAAQFIDVANQVVQKNAWALPKYGDFWIDFRVTRGASRDSFSPPASTIVICDPIPFKTRAPLFRDGIKLVTPSIRRTPPSSVSPRIKSHNYLNFVLAEQEVKDNTPGAWALLLDEHGNLAEGSSSNVFVVHGNEIYTPREQMVLPGITRATVMKLARDLGYTVVEKDLDLRDTYLADEVFLTSTSLCACGVSQINGRAVRNGAFGPVTTKILKAYSELAGVDVRKQYLAFL